MSFRKTPTTDRTPCKVPTQTAKLGVIRIISRAAGIAKNIHLSVGCLKAQPAVTQGAALDFTLDLSIAVNAMDVARLASLSFGAGQLCEAISPTTRVLGLIAITGIP